MSALFTHNGNDIVIPSIIRVGAISGDNILRNSEGKLTSNFIVYLSDAKTEYKVIGEGASLSDIRKRLLEAIETFYSPVKKVAKS